METLQKEMMGEINWVWGRSEFCLHKFCQEEVDLSQGLNYLCASLFCQLL